MKILFASRSDALTKLGGDTIQMLNTKKTMEDEFGVEITIVVSEKEILESDAKILHIFNIQNADETLKFAIAAKNSKKKVFLSTIFWDLSHHFYASFLSRFLGIHSLSIFHEIMYKYFVNLFKFLSIFRTEFKYFSESQKTKYRKILSICDCFLPNSPEELLKLTEYCDFKDIKPVYYIYNSVNDYFFNQKSLNKSEKILCIGRIEPTKNQLSSVLASLELNYPIKIIGKSDKKYKRYLKEILKCNNTEKMEVFDGTVEQNEIAEIMSSSKVHILTSFRESPGLSTLEALVSGANVVISDSRFCPIEFYFSDLIDKKVFICNPYSVKSIKIAIKKAMSAENYTFDFSFLSYKNSAHLTYVSYINLINKI